MKDFIDIYDEDGKVEKMELVLKFNLKGYSHNYIIYRDLEKKHYYIAKYNGENMVDLDTNLSDKELELAELIFKKVVDENEIRN